MTRKKVRTRTFQMRTTDEFLSLMEELSAAFGMSKTELVEFAIRMYPKLAEQECKDE